ncbi:MAG: tetratricopeptide repeat protein [Planctomycetota bacterium]
MPDSVCASDLSTLPRGGGAPAGRLPKWTLPVLALATLAVYLPAIPSAFIGWDDVYYITANRVVTDPGGLRRIWLTTEAPQYYPLAFTSYWLEYRVWGEWAGGYYLTNVVLHTLSALLVAVLARQLGLGPWPALLAGALFALHPVQVGSVSWLAQRKNTLAAVFGLLSCVLYLRHRARGGTLPYGLALTCFLAAMFSKTVVLLVPVVLALADGLIFRRGLAGTAVRLGPWLVLGLPSLIVSASVEAKIATALPEPLLRPLGAAAAAWFYVGKLAWPAVLLPVYSRWTVSAAAPQYWAAMGGLVLAAACVGIWRRRLGSVAVWGLVAWLVLLAPGLGLVRFGHLLHASVADHLVYGASFALFIAVAALVEGGFRSSRAARTGAVVVALAVLAALSTKTVVQARLWADRDHLWAYTLAHNPRSFIAHSQVGWTRYRAGDLPAALEHFRESIRLDPEFGFGYSNIGAVLAAQGKPAEAVPYLRRAVELEPTNHDAYFTLGVCLLDLGQAASAVETIRAGLRLQPGEFRARANLGAALAQLGRYDEAAESFAAALATDPNQPALRVQVARLHLVRGRPAEAVAEYERALPHLPADAGLQREYAEARRAAGLPGR